MCFLLLSLPEKHLDKNVFSWDWIELESCQLHISQMWRLKNKDPQILRHYLHRVLFPFPLYLGRFVSTSTNRRKQCFVISEARSGKAVQLPPWFSRNILLWMLLRRPSSMLREAWAPWRCHVSGLRLTAPAEPSLWVIQPGRQTCEWGSLQMISAPSFLSHPWPFTSSQLRPQTLWSRRQPPCCALSKFLTHHQWA